MQFTQHASRESHRGPKHNLNAKKFAPPLPPFI